MRNPWEYEEDLPDCECPEGVALEIDDACPGCYYDEVGRPKPPPPPTVIVIDMNPEDDDKELF